jgi:hypothetical protein
MDDMTALYENSKPFMKFLKKQGMDNVLKKTKLRLREPHTIVPHVCASFFLKRVLLSAGAANPGSLGREIGSFTRFVRRKRELVLLCVWFSTIYASLSGFDARIVDSRRRC